MQYVIPELVVSQNAAALKCLTRIKTQQDVRELQLQQQDRNNKMSHNNNEHTSPVSDQATVASSQNDHPHFRSRGNNNNNNSITGATVSEEQHVSDLLLEYSCPVVARVLTDMWWSADSDTEKKQGNPFEFILNHVKRGYTINEYIDCSFLNLLKTSFGD